MDCTYKEKKEIIWKTACVDIENLRLSMQQMDYQEPLAIAARKHNEIE